MLKPSAQAPSTVCPAWQKHWGQAGLGTHLQQERAGLGASPQPILGYASSLMESYLSAPTTEQGLGIFLPFITTVSHCPFTRPSQWAPMGHRGLGMAVVVQRSQTHGHTAVCVYWGSKSLLLPIPHLP